MRNEALVLTCRRFLDVPISASRPRLFVHIRYKDHFHMPSGVTVDVTAELIPKDGNSMRRCNVTINILKCFFNMSSETNWMPQPGCEMSVNACLMLNECVCSSQLWASKGVKTGSVSKASVEKSCYFIMHRFDAFKNNPFIAESPPQRSIGLVWWHQLSQQHRIESMKNVTWTVEHNVIAWKHIRVHVRCVTPLMMERLRFRKRSSVFGWKDPV